jgi:propionate CoA-transferase
MPVDFLAAPEAAALIGDSDTVVVDGSGGGVNEPDSILAAIECRFLNGDGPRDLCVVHPSGMGDGEGSGIEHLGYRKLVRRVVGGHWAWSDRMQALAAGNEIEAYCLPQGVMSHLFREIAGKRPGVVTHIGLDTFVDPRHDAGRLNEAARVEDLVEVVQLDGTEWLFYKAFTIHVAIIRGTQVDDHGNLTMTGEGLFAETLSIAQATKNCGGIVLAQARDRVAAGTLDPRSVKVPGVLVDAVVLEPDQAVSADSHRDATLIGAARADLGALEPMALNPRKIIARRAAQELHQGDVVNLGFGMPDGVAAVLAEAGESTAVTFTVEQGHIGGVPAGGRDFGLARNQWAMVDAGYQFDWYDGGGLDVTVLSFAEVDRHGNVNVSRFGDRIAGVGGFVNISQGSKRVVFVGTFSTVGTKINVTPDGLEIVEEGQVIKFVDDVQQISFSARRALATDRPVVYVTERAVFELTTSGPVLREVAPGIDPRSDVAAHLPFDVDVAGVRMMTPELFSTTAMRFGLVDEVTS